MSLPPAVPMGEDTPASSAPLFSIRIDVAQKSIIASENVSVPPLTIFTLPYLYKPAFTVQALLMTRSSPLPLVSVPLLQSAQTVTVKLIVANCESQKSNERKSVVTEVSFLSDPVKKHLYFPPKLLQLS